MKRNSNLSKPRISQLLNLSPWFVYLFSIAITLFTLWVRLQLGVPFVTRTLMLLFILPIIISAYLGGLWTGMLSTLIAAICIWFFLIPPVHSFQIAGSYDFIQWSVLIVCGVLVSVLTEFLHRSRKRMDIVANERSQIEQALNASEENYRDLVENSQTLICTHDLAGNLLSVNEAAVKLTGYSRVTLLRTNLKETLISNGTEQFAGYIKEITTHGHAKGTMKVRIKNGETRIWAFENTLRSNGENEPIIRGFAQDITERAQAEEILRQSEERSRHTLDTMLEGCQTLNFDWRYIYLNPSAEIHNRRLNTELLGNTYMDMWPGIESTEVFRVLKRCMEERIPWQMQNEFAYPDGVVRWFELAIHPIPEGIFILSVDITEHKLAQEQLLKTLEELKRSNSELEQFAYVASHDLQEPLRAVAGMVQLLQKRYHGQLDERADEYISLAMDGANRMQTLITDLLEYSRVDRRGNPLQPTDANAALMSALRNLHGAIQQSGATVTNGTLPTVKADATQITQLFQNLIGNAIKFRGENPPQIHIEVEELPDAWHFSVRDNGIGIEPQYFERIFLVFQRLHTRREYSGTGIGLSICKKIVERHGGRIWVESEPGQGATFHFTIPHRS